MMNRNARMGLIGALLAMLLGACGLDDPPDYYVEAQRVEMFFVVPLGYMTSAAFLQFRTAKPQRPPMPDIRVITWANEGGNIWDGTLGDITIDSPTERGKLLFWSAAAVPPAAGEFDQLGVELRPLLPTVAYAPPPRTGGYAVVDFMGAGVREIGEWIDALLQLWAQCRGDIGQLIPCHGLNYVLAPKIWIEAFAVQGAPMAEELSVFEYILAPEIYIARTSIGWLYRAPQPDDWKPIDAYPTYGPFETPEEMARHATATLNLLPAWEWENMADESRHGGVMASSEMPRLGKAMHEAVNLAARPE